MSKVAAMMTAMMGVSEEFGTFEPDFLKKVYKRPFNMSKGQHSRKKKKTDKLTRRQRKARNKKQRS